VSSHKYSHGLPAGRSAWRHLCFAALTLALVAPVAAQPKNAQTPAARTAAPAPAAAPAVLPPPAEPTPAQMAVARELITSSGIAGSFQLVVPQYLDQIGGALTRTRPDIAADLNTVLLGLKPEFEKQVGDMTETGARLFAQRFSQKELEDIVAFFKSASGKKYVGSQPILMSDLFVALQGWSQKISVDMMSRVREEMRKKGHEL
jgi:hypothetical protein